jgi:hypothetical protein
MTAAKYDISIDQGSDFSVTITVSEGGNPKTLVGFGARASMRKHLDAEASTDFVCSIPSPLLGQIAMNMPHSSSKSLKAGDYVYDLEIYTGSEGYEESVSRIMQGKATLNREVTR